MLSSGLTLIASCQGTSLPGIEPTVAPVLAERGATFCEVSNPILWSQKDTPLTVVQIKKHNQTGKDLECPGWITSSSLVPQ